MQDKKPDYGRIMEITRHPDHPSIHILKFLKNGIFEDDHVESAILNLQEKYRPYKDRFKWLVVDFGELNRLVRSSVFNELMETAAWLRMQGGDLIICNVKHPEMQELFRLTHLDALGTTPIDIPVEEAVAELVRQQALKTKSAER